MRLKNKVILVTASTRGIGLAIVHKCAVEGAQVYMAARNMELAQEIADTLNGVKCVHATGASLVSHSTRYTKTNSRAMTSITLASCCLTLKSVVFSPNCPLDHLGNYEKNMIIRSHLQSLI